MKILLITTSFDKATTGAGTAARMIAGMSKDKPGISFDILSEEFERTSHGRIHCQLSRLSKLPLLNYWTRARDYARSISRVTIQNYYDIIWFHDLWLAGRIEVRDQNTRVIGFIHDDNTLKAENISGISGRTVGFRVRRMLERKAMRIVDEILTNSNHMVKALQEEYPDSSINRVYYSGMDYEKVLFSPVVIDPQKPIRILFMKRDFRRGGLKKLLRALRSLGQFQFYLTVAGPPAREVESAFDPELVNADNVKTLLVGPIESQEDVSALYRQHDLVCVPSDSEALGLVNAEALAHGIPVVSTRVGGIPEVLGDGKFGYMAQDDSVASLADAIRECIECGERTKEKLFAGRKHVISRFGAKQMYNDLFHILSTVMDSVPVSQPRPI